MVRGIGQLESPPVPEPGGSGCVFFSISPTVYGLRSFCRRLEILTFYKMTVDRRPLKKNFPEKSVPNWWLGVLGAITAFFPKKNVDHNLPLKNARTPVLLAAGSPRGWAGARPARPGLLLPVCACFGEIP